MEAIYKLDCYCLPLSSGSDDVVSDILYFLDFFFHIVLGPVGCCHFAIAPEGNDGGNYFSNTYTSYTRIMYDWRTYKAQ